MQLPSTLAIVTCAAHQTAKTPIAIGNNLADEAAKEATGSAVQGPMVHVAECEPITNLASLIEAQNNVSEAEKRLWVQRGAARLTHPHVGLWRSSRGHFVLPLSLLPTAIKIMHGPDHCSRAQVVQKLQTVW